MIPSRRTARSKWSGGFVRPSVYRAQKPPVDFFVTVGLFVRLRTGGLSPVGERALISSHLHES